MVQVFVSYASEDTDTAVKIQDYFESYLGFSCFMASKKIYISEDFIYRIKWYIRKSILFIPLVSKNLKKSEFANQEIGYAIAHERNIIPISIDRDHPGGLIANLQDAILSASNEDSIISAIIKIYTAIIEISDLWICREDAKEGLIDALCKSNHFRKTAFIIPLIIKTDNTSKFDKSLLKKIYEASKSNQEIYNYCYFSKLKDFLISKGFIFS